jgi:hypothetical protein
MKILITIVVLFLGFHSLNAQNVQDTIKIKTTINKRSPQIAAFQAAVLPGWGQVYNKRYWKLPIVYAGFIGIGYGVYFNQQQYLFFRDSYAGFVASGTTADLRFNQIKYLRNAYRRNTELLIIVGVAWYALTIVDAVVDAHFSDFDVSDKISMKFHPTLHALPDGTASVGFGVKFQLK